MKKYLILLALLVLFSSCTSKNNRVTEDEQNAPTIAKASPLYEPFTKVGTRYSHYFKKAVGNPQKDSVYGVNSGDELVKVAEDKNYFYNDFDKILYQHKLPLTENVTVIGLINDILVVHELDHRLSTIEKSLNEVDGQKILNIKAGKLFNINTTENKIVLTLGVTTEKNGLSGTAGRLLVIDLLGTITDLGEMGFFPPRGYSIKPVFQYLAVADREYYVGMGKIYQITKELTLVDTEIVMNNQQPIISYFTTEGNTIKAIRRAGNENVLCIWDKDWNVLENNLIIHVDNNVESNTEYRHLYRITEVGNQLEIIGGRSGQYEGGSLTKIEVMTINLKTKKVEQKLFDVQGSIELLV
ncbi:MAG: hypothetical protein ACRC6X_05285 [Culicoidibacterales bacterium]